jgi:hypothetical protein
MALLVSGVSAIPFFVLNDTAGGRDLTGSLIAITFCVLPTVFAEAENRPATRR